MQKVQKQSSPGKDFGYGTVGDTRLLVGDSFWY